MRSGGALSIPGIGCPRKSGQADWTNKVHSSFPDFLDGMVARVLLAPLKLAAGSALVLMGLIAAAWVVDLVWVAHFWPDRVTGLRSLLAEELAAGRAIVARQGGDVRTLIGPANGLFFLIFDASGLLEMGQKFTVRESLSIPDTVARSAWIARHEAIETMMLGTQLLGVRAAILARLLLLLGLLSALGFIEGIHKRAIRRSRVARESACLYHRAKCGQLIAFALGAVLQLLWPAPVNWTTCAMCNAVLLGVMASLQWAQYKKHI